jgi:hypothetical protein
MLKSIAEKLIKYCKENQWTFVLRGKECSYDEMFADFGVLPGMLKRAEKYTILCEGASIGAEFTDDEKTLLGYKVKLEKCHIKEPVLMLYLLYVLDNIVNAGHNGSEIQLDQLTYE